MQSSGGRESASISGAAAQLGRGVRAASLASGSDEVFSGAQHLVGTDLPTTLGIPSGTPDDLDKEAMPLTRASLEARALQAIAHRSTEPSAVASDTVTAAVPPRKQIKRLMKPSR